MIFNLEQRYPTLFEALPGGIWNKITDERFLHVNKLRGVAALKVASTYAPVTVPSLHEAHIYAQNVQTGPR